MIGFLHGHVMSHTGGECLLRVGDVGYRVWIPEGLSHAHPKGAELDIYVHHHFREAEQELYGFATLDELDLFEKLISVSGIGPKIGLAALSTSSLDRLRNAIATGEPAYLTSISGIGAKTAQRMILELKGKVFSSSPSGMVVSGDDEVVQALIGLGYSTQEARTIVAKIPESAQTMEARLKEALKLMAR